MFLRNLITTSTESCSEQINRLKNEIKNADAIVIGAGAVSYTHLDVYKRQTLTTAPLI